jgi:hypothetical protein
MGYPKPNGTATAIATAVNISMNGFYGSTAYIAPTYLVTPDAQTVNEGTPVVFTITTTNVPNGTVFSWRILDAYPAALLSTIDGFDFVPAGSVGPFAIPTGNVTVNNNTASVVITFTADQRTDGLKAFQLQIGAAGGAGPWYAYNQYIVMVHDTSLATISYVVSPSATSVNEGSTVTFSITTTNVPDGTPLYWSNAGTTSATDFTPNASLGGVTISGGTASFSLTLANDATTEGPETIVVQLRTGSTTGPIVATAATVTVNDTSTTPVVPTTALYTFTSANPSWTVPAGTTSITILAVGGGGAGGQPDGSTNEGGGGGGGGGVVYQRNISIPGGTVLNIQVGAGGAPAAGRGHGGAGSDTSISYNLGGGPSAIVAYGSGGGGGYADYAGGSGASGGGGNPWFSAGGGGSALYGTQGNAGSGGNENNYGGGGGGYASPAPAPGAFYTNNFGGLGAYFTLLTTDVSVGGGGGGGANGGAFNGGGAGGAPSVAGTAGSANTGGGGGGSGNGFATYSGGAGGSGVVYIITNEPAIVGAPVSTFGAAISQYGGGLGTAQAGVRINSDGTITAQNAGVGFANNTMGTGWFSTTTTNIGYRYWAYITHTGAALDSGSEYIGRWVQLYSYYPFAIHATAGNTSGTIARSCSLTIQISDSKGGAVLATATITLDADATGNA